MNSVVGFVRQMSQMGLFCEGSLRSGESGSVGSLWAPGSGDSLALVMWIYLVVILGRNEGPLSRLISLALVQVANGLLSLKFPVHCVCQNHLDKSATLTRIDDRAAIPKRLCRSIDRLGDMLNRNEFSMMIWTDELCL